MTEIILTYYKKQDCNHFLKSIDDRESMHDTWKEWHKVYQKTKKEIILQGFKVKDFEVDIDELMDYCKIKRNKERWKSTFRICI